MRTHQVRHAAVIEVSDTGEGIEKKHLPHIFDAFYTTHAESKHSGLGLSVSDATIRSHGGKIEVRTAVGEGATFSVWLPAVATKDLRESSEESGGKE